MGLSENLHVQKKTTKPSNHAFESRPRIIPRTMPPKNGHNARRKKLTVYPESHPRIAAPNHTLRIIPRTAGRTVGPDVNGNSQMSFGNKSLPQEDQSTSTLHPAWNRVRASRK